MAFDEFLWPLTIIIKTKLVSNTGINMMRFRKALNAYNLRSKSLLNELKLRQVNFCCKNYQNSSDIIINYSDIHENKPAPSIL